MKNITELEELSYQQLLDLETEINQIIVNKSVESKEFYNDKLVPLYNQRSDLFTNEKQIREEIKELYENYEYKNRDWIQKYWNRKQEISKKLSLIILIFYYLGVIIFAK